MSNIYDKLNSAGRRDRLEPDRDSGSDSYFPGLKGIRTGVSVSLVLAAIALAAGGLAFRAAASQKTDTQKSQMMLMQLKQKVNDFEAESESYRDQFISLKSELEKGASSQTDFRDLKKEIDKRKAEILDLKDKVEALEAAQRGIQEVPEETSPPDEYSGVDEEDSGTTVPSMSESPVPPVPSQPAAIPSAAASPEAGSGVSKVLSVNEKFNFVVVNLGLQNGAKIGDQLLITRGGRKIALVQIEKLYDSFSAATILDQDKNAPLQQGDEVKKAD